MTKETGIIMSGDHPKLILDGRKTMTRRTWGLERVNSDPDKWILNDFRVELKHGQATVSHSGKPNKNWEFIFWQAPTFHDAPDGSYLYIKCPYGQVGGRLWVKEAHYRWGHWAKHGLPSTGKQKWIFNALNREVAYLDHPPPSLIHNNKSREINGWFKRPSIFMPRWASRILLEITELRTERLQDITEMDAIEEGVRDLSAHKSIYKPDYPVIDEFIDIWDSLNAKSGYSWDSNPWVWVISLERLKL